MHNRSPFSMFEDPRVTAATLGAGALVADQVMGKALRDALFLEHVGIEQLPSAMLLSAVLSTIVVISLSRASVKRSPRRVASAVLIVSAALFALAWSLFPNYPRAGAWLTYVHTRSLTPAAVSVFWAVVTRSFDPRLARLAVPRVLAGATLGGVVGGFVTWRLAWLSDPADLLLAGAALSLGALVFAARLRTGKSAQPAANGELGWRALSEHLPYLRAIAALVALTSMTQAILDYLLSSAALSALGRGPSLLSFFALFQAAIAVLAFALQVSISPGLLGRFGIGRVLAVAPLAIALGTMSSLLLGPLVVAVLLRGTDGVLGASLQRSGYEVLFAPLDDARRRVSKPIIDVAVDRAGTLMGGALVSLIVWLSEAHAAALLLGITVLLAVARVLVVPELESGYRRLLAEGLQRSHGALSSESILDPATIRSLSVGAAGLDQKLLVREIERVRREQLAPAVRAQRPALSLAAFDLPAKPETSESAAAPADGVLAALTELRAGDEQRARVVLRALRSEPVLVPQVVLLLGADALARDAADWISAQQPAPIGALSDALLAQDLDATIRRRVARLLGKSDDERAARLLLDALPRVPVDVRLGVVQALARLGSRRSLAPAPLLAAAADLAAASDDAEERVLEQVFTLLAAAYPGEPIQRAYRALALEGQLRGTALEWLDTLLPHPLKAVLWPRIAPQEEVSRSRRRNAEELRRHLAASELGGEEAVDTEA
jgi:ATP:ADP antiporter, AAA family